MQHFKDRIKNHAEHVANVGTHCSTEETTKQALILPLLDILGFNPFDPTRVKAEYGADFPGVKASERVDYALFCQGVPVMFIEAKAYNEKLSNHSAQLSRYFNATPEVAIGAVTNGREWRFFTDLGNKNMMDAEPFLSIDFTNIDDPLIPRLYQADKKTPCVTLPIELTKDHRTQIQKAGLQIGAADAILIGPPENLLRIAALVFESLEYSRNDDNFRRTTQGA